MYHNIEESAFRRGEYVGYADGVWRVTKNEKNHKKWLAVKRDGPAKILYADTLRELSEKLEKEKENGK